MVVIQSPERVKALDFGLTTLLPVDPPEIHTFLFIGVVEALEIGLNEFWICNVKFNRIAGSRVDPHCLGHRFVTILKAAHAACGMDVERCVEILFLEPAKEGAIIWEQLCIPAVARPSAVGHGVKPSIHWGRMGGTPRGSFAKTAFHICPMPIHIDGCHSDRDFFINKALH